MSHSQASLEKEVDEEQSSQMSHVRDTKPEIVADAQPSALEAAQINKGEPEGGWLTGMKLATVIGPLILVFFLILLDTTIVSTAIPKITSQFNSLDDIGVSLDHTTHVMPGLTRHTVVYRRLPARLCYHPAAGGEDICQLQEQVDFHLFLRHLRAWVTALRRFRQLQYAHRFPRHRWCGDGGHPEWRI